MYFAMNADSSPVCSTVLSPRQESMPWNTQVSTAKRACPPGSQNPFQIMFQVPRPRTFLFKQSKLTYRVWADFSQILKVWCGSSTDMGTRMSTGMCIRPVLLLTLPGQAWNSEEFGNSKFKPGVQGFYKGVSVSVEFLSIF